MDVLTTAHVTLTCKSNDFYPVKTLGDNHGVVNGRILEQGTTAVHARDLRCRWNRDTVEEYEELVISLRLQQLPGMARSLRSI
jgi:hypothetical protein